MKPAGMDESEYRAKLTAATVCYAAMLVVISFFLINLLTQGVKIRFLGDSGEMDAVNYIENTMIIVGSLWILIISVNALYVKSKALFLELGFELCGFLSLLQRDMKPMGMNVGSSIQKNRDYYWLSLIMVVGCVFFLFSLTFMPAWVAFLFTAGILNISARRV